jgi:hypothetical protein
MYLNRTQLRKAARERVNAENKQIADKFGIPKAFIAYARHHGKQVVDIVQQYAKQKSALSLDVKKHPRSHAQ